MEKAIFINATYVKSSTIEHRGNQPSIQRYLNDGYHVVDERNGYWILGKPAAVMVTLKSSSEVYTFNMKDSVTEYYGKDRISEKLYNTFFNDAVSGRIKFYMDNNNGYCLK